MPRIKDFPLTTNFVGDLSDEMQNVYSEAVNIHNADIVGIINYRKFERITFPLSFTFQAGPAIVNSIAPNGQGSVSFDDEDINDFTDRSRFQLLAEFQSPNFSFSDKVRYRILGGKVQPGFFRKEGAGGANDGVIVNQWELKNKFTDERTDETDPKRTFLILGICSRNIENDFADHPRLSKTTFISQSITSVLDDEFVRSGYYDRGTYLIDEEHLLDKDLTFDNSVSLLVILQHGSDVIESGAAAFRRRVYDFNGSIDLIAEISSV